MITIKTLEEIELMRESALIVSKTLGMLAAEVKPGVSTLQLDTLAEAFIRDHGDNITFHQCVFVRDTVYNLCIRTHTKGVGKII